MKIKDIQQYREVFKNVIRNVPDRNENFIGNYYFDHKQEKRVRGWFDLYFGQADGNSTAQKGVENKLISFLDMARDGQAIYEFLQNAVDAGASKFLMFYKTDADTNEDYLMVINNGEMFTTESIISILNIGSSTKTNNSEKIGQFGIGFKLAHRLVGKDNAIAELLNELNGPILYSWKNNEIANLRAPLAVENFEYSFDEKSHKLTIADDNSWLFKILLTTFPCAYNEKPVIWDGEVVSEPPFSEKDLNFLRGWLNEESLQQHLTEDFEQGALFLMKLGEGKLKEIKDEPNLKEGVRFSLSILKETSERGNGLTTAVINEEKVHHPELDFHKIIIPKEDKDQYAYIRFGRTYNELDQHQINELANESAIQILFGFKNYKEIGDFFKGSPSFYLYFPVSQEVHNFNYIFHSNALYKGSSRVFLQAGGGKGLNERLFEKTVELLEKDLRRLFSNDIDKFKNLYSAFLTSGETQNNESEWISRTYTRPINEMLKRIVPVKNDQGELFLLDSTSTRNPIYLIDTKVRILENYNYFLLDKAEISLEYSFKAFDKLNLKSYNIYDILNIQDISTRLNRWINDNEDKAKLFYKELTENQNTYHPNSLSDVQKANLVKIRWIQLSSDAFSTIEEIEKNTPIILLSKVLEPVREIFHKLNIITSKYDLSAFIDKYRGNFQQNELRQFTYSTLTAMFSEQVETEDLDKLNNEERFALFEAFRTLDNNPGGRLNLLKLYKNKLGNYQPLGRLANVQGGLLGLFSIDPSQLTAIDSRILQNYLKVDPSTLYEKIYFPQWKDLLEYINQNLGTITPAKIVSEMSYAFNHSNWSDKETRLLSSHQVVIYNGKVIETTNLLISQTDNIDNYIERQASLERFYKTYLPDQQFLELFTINSPFGYKTELNDPELLLENISEQEVFEILNLARKFKLNFFEDNTIQKCNASYNIISSRIKEQYFAKDAKIIELMDDLYKTKYELLPNAFEEFDEMVNTRGIELHKLFICNISAFENIGTIHKFLEVAVSFAEESRIELFNKLEKITLNFEEDSNKIKKLAEFIYSVKRIDLNELQSKIALVRDQEEVHIIDLTPSIATLILNHHKIDFDKIFGANDSGNIAGDFYHQFIEQSELDKSFFRKLLKLDDVDDNGDLKIAFLNSLNDGNELATIYQLYYAVFSGEFTQDELKDFYLLGVDGEFYSLNNSWVFSEDFDIKFFNSSNLIDKSYNEEPELLIDLVNHSERRLIKQFRLDTDTDYAVLDLESDHSLSDKLGFMYKVYLRTPLSSRVLNWANIDAYLGITPYDKIVAQTFRQETDLTDEIFLWCNDDLSKRAFLKDLGFKFEDSQTILFLTAVQHNNCDFSEFNINQFEKEGIELIVDFLFRNDILFSLNNTALRNVLVALFKIYWSYRQDKMLSYIDGQAFQISTSDELCDFDYTIIDQILSNSSNEVLTEFFKQYNIPINEIADLFGNEKLNKVDLKFEIIHDKANLVTDYFYNEWKKSVKNINIYKGDALVYDVCFKINGDDVRLCEISYNDDFWLIPHGNQLAVYYTTNKSLKSVVDHFTSADYESYENYNLKIALRNLEELYNSFNATISEVLENTDIEEIKGYFQSQIEKEERRVHREGITSEIKQTAEYSKTWFMKYLEYLNTVTEKNSSQDLQFLRFSKIEKTDNPNFYKLSGCSAAIPENIDESTNVNILIISASQRQSYSIKNISQKNQTVLVQLNESLPDTLVDNFFVGEITYSPTIDLLGRLTNAFDHLEDWEDINEKFPPIQYIYGPPGTGKTTWLKNKIIELAKENSNVKVLVLTPTNKACDVLAEKLYGEGFDQFIRLSSPTSTMLPEEMYSNELTDVSLENLNVLISTIHRHSYFKVNTEHSQYYLYNYQEWNYIIIDEASMINLPYITFSVLITAQNNTNCQLIIAGDPKQIPPVPELKDAEREEIGVETENIYSMFGLKSFDKEIQKSEIRDMDRVDNLAVQFRSLPEIGNLFSEFSYKGHVSSHRQSESKRTLPTEVQKLLSKTITFLNVPLEKDNQLFSINKLIYSSYHLYSGLLIYEFIQFFDNYNKDDEQWTIGIISPYKAQAVLVSRLIVDLKLKTNIRVYADTVHGFQGDECDIVFFICNPSSYQTKPHDKSLLANDFIYNVAISRAKDYLVIVNPFQKLKDNEYLNRLKVIHSNYIKENVNIQSSLSYENIMFGNDKFLDENTFITRHDDVNVYTSDVYRYYIKKNEISIDFQITKT